MNNIGQQKNIFFCRTIFFLDINSDDNIYNTIIMFYLKNVLTDFYFYLQRKCSLSQNLNDLY